MTEGEWDARDSIWDLSAGDLVGLFGTSDRKLFLFLDTFLPRMLPDEGCGFCRSSLRLFGGQADRGRRIEEWGEVERADHPGISPARECRSRDWFRWTRLYLDGDIDRAELWNRLFDVGCWIHEHVLSGVHAASGMDGVRHRIEHRKEIYREGYRGVKEVLGNPFRPVSLDPVWLNSNVLNLAQSAYDERIMPSGELDHARLAVLSDALEELGCDEDILIHLRSTGPHVRGCWAVDLLLGKG